MGELLDGYKEARLRHKEWLQNNKNILDDINTAYRGVSHRQNKQEAEIVDLWKGQEKTADILDQVMNCIEGLKKDLEEVKARHDALVNRLKEKFSGEQS